MSGAVVTGLGVCCAAGSDTQAFWSALLQARSAVAPFECDGLAPGKARVAAQITGFDPSTRFSQADLGLYDRFTQLALIAAQEALTDAGLVVNDAVDPMRVGIVLGTGTGARITSDDAVVGFARGKRIAPSSIPRGLFSAPVSHISMRHGFTGPCWTVSTACASSNHAIGHALMLIESGICDVVITGGSEACLTAPFFAGWEALRILAPDTCRPFSAERKGLVLGEGAAIAVLESTAHARARQAPGYARVAGWGFTADAHHITEPAPKGPADAMRAALAAAGLRPEDVTLINAHGTGTMLNDRIETAALHEVFGDQARSLVVSATKSVHGHALGASGALELVATVLSLHHGVAPPTANYVGADPACDLDYVTDGPRQQVFQAALSNSFAFGGLNAVVALTRADFH